MSENNGFTPTHKRMLEVLSDGLPHSREELHACLQDELSELSAIQRHISTLRKKLARVGEDVVCEYRQRSYFYRHVRLLNSPYNGYS